MRHVLTLLDREGRRNGWSERRGGARSTYCACLLQLLQLFEGARPVVLEEARQRPIGKQAAGGLANRAVVGLVLGVADALHRRSAVGAWLAVAPVYREAVTEGSHLAGTGKVVTELFTQDADPAAQRLLRRRVESRDLFVGELAGLLDR